MLSRLLLPIERAPMPRILCLVLLLFSLTAFSAEPPRFATLLEEADLVLRPIPGTTPVAVQDNPLFPYDYALDYGEDLKIFYMVRPLARMRIDYEDPHNAAPDPNHLFPLLFQSLVGLLSGGNYSPSREYPPAQAQEKFRADWAAAAVFDLAPDFPSDHSQALLIAIHKNQRGDAYMLFLFDHYPAVKRRIQGALNRLAFRAEPEAQQNQKAGQP